MNSAWNLVRQGDSTMGDGLKILDYLAYSVSQEGNPEQARNLTLLLAEKYPNEERYKDNIAYYNTQQEVNHRPSSSSEVDYNLTLTLTPPQPSYPEKSTYEKLCRESTVYDPDIVPQLKCFYFFGPSSTSTSSLYLSWAPIKTKILFPSPLIVQFYDIISDNESEIIRKLAQRQLKRATIRDPKTGVLRTADYRIQKTTWLEENIPDDNLNIVAKGLVH